MKVRIQSVVPLCLFVAGFGLGAAPAALAQNQSSNVHGPDKYMYLSNETLKPNTFSEVVKNESAEVQALRNANSPGHYFGMVSITGASRAIFFSGYDSFAQMQKDHDTIMSNAALAATLRSSNAAEAHALTEHSGSVYEYRKDLSLSAPVDLSQMRFFDITLYKVRSGHYQDFERLAKLYIKALGNDSDIHFATFEKMYGVGSDSVFIICSPMKSLAEVDQEVADFDKLPSTVGEAQLQTMRQLGSATIKSSEDDLFAIVPQISYVPTAWVTASPDFWGKK